MYNTTIPGAALGGVGRTLNQNFSSNPALDNSMAQLLATLMQVAGSLVASTSNTGFPQASPAFGAAGTPAVGPTQNLNGFLGGKAGAGSAGGATGSAPAAQTKDKGEIQGYIADAAKAYGADPKVLTEMARRESNFDTGAVNDWDSNAKKGTPSKGLFQFIEPTFKSMAPKAKKANPKAWDGMGEFNWQDWRQQSLVAAWAVANGQGSHWATYKAAGGK